VTAARTPLGGGVSDAPSPPVGPALADDLRRLRGRQLPGGRSGRAGQAIMDATQTHVQEQEERTS
jgi:hypothetical protein